VTVHANLVGETFPEHISTQGQVAEWTQRKFSEHKDNTQEWKNSKENPSVSVVVVPDGSKLPLTISWYCNRNASVLHLTFSTTEEKTKLCLDYDITTNAVGVSVCYPTQYPNTTIDPSQKWTWEEDSTIRPYSYRNLCLSTLVVLRDVSANPDDAHLFLLPCNDDVGQRWAWHGGPVPETGKKKGKLSMGYYYVGLVNSTSILFT